MSTTSWSFEIRTDVDGAMTWSFELADLEPGLRLVTPLEPPATCDGELPVAPFHQLTQLGRVLSG